MRHQVDFDPATHTYTRRGAELPGVTRILKDAGLTPPYPEDRGWLEFGHAVHKCCELFVQDRLIVGEDGRSYPGTLYQGSTVLWPYINGFAEKVREMRIKPILVEHRVYHDVEGYAGTLDLCCTVFDEYEAIVDLKTGAPPESTALQTALYDLALSRERSHKGHRKRFSFYLMPDRCVVKQYQDDFDYAAALGAVALWKWKRKKR